MARENLKQARKASGMTQKEVAEKLEITERHYRRIEDGSCLGTILLWDSLEDLFGINQRTLRQIFPKGNQ